MALCNGSRCVGRAGRWSGRPGGCGKQAGGLAQRNPPFEVRRHHRKAGYGAHDTDRFGPVLSVRA